MLFGPTSENSMFPAQMVKWWSGEHYVKNSIQNLQFLRSSTVVSWSCFIRQRVGKLCVLDRIMDRFYYRDISELNLQPSVNHFQQSQRCIFMHDNDRKYISGLIKDWLKRERIQIVSWPPYSPDFNHIETLRGELA